MKPISGRDMCRALERQGWVLQRVQGSHYIYWRLGVTRPLPVPVHGNRTLRPGTQRTIMREAGLTDDDL